MSKIIEIRLADIEYTQSLVFDLLKVVLKNRNEEIVIMKDQEQVKIEVVQT